MTGLVSLKGNTPLAATANYGFLLVIELEPAPASVGVFHQNPLNISDLRYISTEREFFVLSYDIQRKDIACSIIQNIICLPYILSGALTP